MRWSSSEEAASRHSAEFAAHNRSAEFADGRERFDDRHFSVIHIGHTEIHLGVFALA